MFDGQRIHGGALAELGAIAANPMNQAAALAFYKALGVSYDTDHANFSGAAAMGRESLESSIISVEQRAEHFVFYNKLPKKRATNINHEWTKEHGLGGIPGSSANSDVGVIALHEGEYDRLIKRIKFLMDRRGVPGVSEITSSNGLGSLVAKETDKGSRKLITDAHYLNLYGNATALPYQFDGFFAQMDAIGGRNVIDLHGASISADGNEIQQACATIWGQDHWGRATDAFCSGEVKKDFNLKLFPSMRAMMDANPASVSLGADVQAITTEFARNRKLLLSADPFLVESQPPYVVRGGNFAAELSSSGTTAISTVGGVAAADAASLFDDGWDGDYYYAAQPTRKEGDGALVKSSAVTVAVGDKVTVTITPGAGNNASGFRIFRGRKNGTNANADFREIALIAANGDSAVTYVDYNQNIPGTSFIAVTTMMDEAMAFFRLADSFRFPLYPSDTFMHLWAQILLGALIILKTEQQVLIKNVLPTSATWNPKG